VVRWVVRAGERVSKAYTQSLADSNRGNTMTYIPTPAEQLTPAEHLRIQADTLEAWSNMESGPPFEYVRIERSALRSIAENIRLSSFALEAPVADTPPAPARCDVAQNGWCRVHHSLDCRAVKDALLAQRTKERDHLARWNVPKLAFDTACAERDEAREALREHLKHFGTYVHEIFGKDMVKLRDRTETLLSKVDNDE
jgi:hypothetical protein